MKKDAVNSFILSGLLVFYPYSIAPLLASDFYMNEDIFWEIIENSSNTINDKKGSEQIENILIDLSPSDLVDFYKLMEKYRAMAFKRELYGAGSLLRGENLSDDSFWYFTCWLISRGRQTYESALINADSLANLPAVLEDDYGVDVYFQGYCEVVVDVFENKTGQNIFDVAKEKYEKDKSWFGYTTDELKQNFPNLWAKYGYLRDKKPTLIENILSKFIVGLVVFLSKFLELLGSILNFGKK